MKRSLSILVLTLGAVLFTTSIATAAGSTPEGKVYFIYLLGLEADPYQPSADCLVFDATQACPLNGDFCLNWQRTEGGRQTTRESGFSFTGEIDDEGLLITLEGQGRFDTRGRKSSISAVGRAAALDAQVNFTFSGRQVGRNRCLQLVEDFFND